MNQPFKWTDDNFKKALELSKFNKCKKLSQLFNTSPEDNTEKIKIVKKIFQESGSAKATKQAIEYYTNLAFIVLDSLSISEENKFILRTFGEKLMNRTV